MTPLNMHGVTSDFDVHSPSVADYENAKGPLWDPSTNEYSERESHMTVHCGQIIVCATMARGYTVAYNVIDLMNDDNFVTASEEQSWITVAVIKTVRKQSMKSKVMAR